MSLRVRLGLGGRTPESLEGQAGLVDPDKGWIGGHIAVETPGVVDLGYQQQVGHSGPVSWTFDNLLRSTDAAALTNHMRPTILTQWGCWNDFIKPSRPKKCTGDCTITLSMRECAWPNSDSATTIDVLIGPWCPKKAEIRWFQTRCTAKVAKSRGVIFELQCATAIQEFVFRLHDTRQVASGNGAIDLDGVASQPLRIGVGETGEITDE